jgi:uncharacterized membrane protein YraQ (UPF0718 family)
MKENETQNAQMEPGGLPGGGMSNPAMRKRMMKMLLKSWAIVTAIAIAAFVLLRFFPDKQPAVMATAWQFFTEMIIVLPAIMILIGLITVWVPRETVLKYLGKTSGLKGVALSVAFGSLPVGPLYLAFPLATTLLDKGASISNTVIFLSAWACIKIPQELMEIQFLGLPFTLTRLALTVVFVTIMGITIEKIIERGGRTGGEKDVSE